MVCESGFYKTSPGNLESCEACPDGYTTFSTASVSAGSCLPPTILSPTSALTENQSEENVSSNVSSSVQLTQNESVVPAITFNMSLGNFQATTNVPELESQLAAVFRSTLSATTRLTADAIQVLILGLGSGAEGRRLAAPVVVITMKHRTEEEAQLTAADVDVAAVSSEVMTAVQQHPRLGVRML